jgi:hypothetical protein
MWKKNQEETNAAQATDDDNIPVKIDIDEARRDLWKLGEVDVEPPAEPMDTYGERVACIEEDKPTITIDIDKALQDLMSLVEVDPEDDDPRYLYDWIMPT